VGTILALANQKGGVGKTTTAVNVAACLAEAGAKTLVVDLDPQANATSGLGERANGTSSYDLLDGAPLEEIVHTTRFENLDVVPSKPGSRRPTACSYRCSASTTRSRGSPSFSTRWSSSARG
jgi:cellulose biosynthesis protein BcsQ